MKRVLIIQTAFIGDVILTTSLVETFVKHAQEETKIEVLVRKGNESLLAGHPHISAVHVWNKKEQKFKNLLQLIKQLRKVKYDRIYNLQRFGSTGFMTWRLKAKQKIGFSKNPFSFSFDKKVDHEIGKGKHEIERNFELIRGEVNGSAPEKPKLYPSQADYGVVADILQGRQSVKVLAPASVWFTKQAPKEKWIELIKTFHADDCIFLIGAPGDANYLEEIKRTSGTENIENLAGKLSLLQSAALIEKAERTYVNDSAPLHLASAMNAPVSAFFCSTVPSFGFGPLSDDQQILQTNQPLECRPCGLHGYKACPKGHFKCGNTIQISSHVK